MTMSMVIFSRYLDSRHPAQQIEGCTFKQVQDYYAGWWRQMGILSLFVVGIDCSSHCSIVGSKLQMLSCFLFDALRLKSWTSLWQIKHHMEN